MIKGFGFSQTPHLLFGTGKLSMLPLVAKAFGSKILLITGARSFLASSQGPSLLEQFRSHQMAVQQYSIDKEPSPAIIDEGVKKHSAFEADCVIAIGGGSALDAGKAISAMLPLNESVEDYLEGAGTKLHPGVKIPFIAIPTTSGTGSEATKNAVISKTGENGYKRSLRHNNFVPNLAIVDPSLTISCPPTTTAASGMDAFTQLLESYLSTTANPLTNALALEGLNRISNSLMKSYREGNNLEARTDMALASYLSGITLANAGLGLVHGFASPMGGYFDIPHGVICSRLMSSANKVTVRKLRLKKTNPEALLKYAGVGKIFSSDKNKTKEYYIDSLLAVIESLTREMNIPMLSQYGIQPEHFKKIVDTTDNKNNPIALDKEEMLEVLEMADGNSEW
ncbi:MAG: iron-containing alcohol dehydrogenase [Cyclobacteriaceae bacterium]